MSLVVQPSPATAVVSPYNPMHLVNGLMHAFGSGAATSFDSNELIWMALGGYLLGANVVGQRVLAGKDPVKLGPVVIY